MVFFFFFEIYFMADVYLILPQVTHESSNLPSSSTRLLHRGADDRCVTSRVSLGHPAQLLGKPYPSGGCTIPQAGGDCKGAMAGSSVVPKRRQCDGPPCQYASITAKNLARAE